MADYELVEMSFDEAEIRVIELHSAMGIVERLGGASPEQTAVIMALAKRERDLRQRQVSVVAKAMLGVLAVYPERVTARSTIRDLEGFILTNQSTEDAQNVKTEVDEQFHSALVDLYNYTNNDRTEWRSRRETRQALARVFAALCRANGQDVLICAPYSLHVYAAKDGKECPYCKEEMAA